ncbi:glycine zipper 2TM domain-containing protein [Phenylobacterium sp.]|uniref:glycine zipper 2TM domain-containing protein n=1 Tax=Phenylobacterium sp. TaxID=1871053 RepID=UPI0025F5860D|nr:glycine zipper 2TM domain-containing protein [Phenylobacterium sp.]MBX3484069.1 glycine zipper 2TM domain-containing protein [Phenylobacterium sp.]MCW5758682.1 glycine zipper 2TM domain-containing protein [Phenylobacterium sp.]
MRYPVIAAGIAALTLIPSLAAAQQTCEERRANRTAGTVVGGVLGALAGSAVAGKGDRTEGAVIGGVGGAVIGNQVSKGSGDCRRAYGYYDNNNTWHATDVDRAYAEGYYDRNGDWIAGAPPAGGWDRDGRWAMNAGGYGAQASYRTRSDWRDAPTDIRARSTWLEQRIVRSRNSGALSRREAQRAMAILQDIRREERGYMRDGRLSARESDTLMARLDALNAQIRWDRRD